jgi:hypothetical protein
MTNRVYKDFLSWLERINQSNPPPEDIVAFNFGLFESTDGYSVYLVGARKYDLNDDDWACCQDYVPLEKYFPLPASFTGGKNWQEIHGDVVSLAKQYLKSPEFASSFLAAASAITVGFDDGDLEAVK